MTASLNLSSLLRRALPALTLAAVLPATALATATPAALPPPHQVVEKATRDVLQRIVKDRPQFQKNPDHLYTIIEENLVPYVDFDRIAKRVMAKYYAQALPEQRAKFQQAFKTSLIRAYGTALANYNDQKFEVVPPGKADVEPARATVNMNITMKDGSVYRVQYAMFTDAAGAWKLENLVLEGINLGLTYRNNFAEMYQQYGGDMDKVINNWSSRVNAQKKADDRKGG
ncbi:MAG: MlaC/ttg2D family ABC transporter substrate-binding protein [Pseudomonadota bacterium]